MRPSVFERWTKALAKHFSVPWGEKREKKQIPAPPGHQGMLEAARASRESLIEAGVWDEVQRRRIEVKRKAKEAA